MHISTRKRVKETEMDMTPMIDIVFLLIAFFMVVTEITRQDDIADLQLPDVTAASPDDDPVPDRLIINIDRGGLVYVSGVEYELDVPADAHKIKMLLAKEARIGGRSATGVANRTVLVRADRRCPFRHIRKIIAMCVDQDIGIWKLAFGTLPFETKEERLKAAGKPAGAGE